MGCNKGNKQPPSKQLATQFLSNMLQTILMNVWTKYTAMPRQTSWTTNRTKSGQTFLRQHCPGIQEIKRRRLCDNLQIEGNLLLLWALNTISNTFIPACFYKIKLCYHLNDYLN